MVYSAHFVRPRIRVKARRAPIADFSACPAPHTIHGGDAHATATPTNDQLRAIAAKAYLVDQEARGQWPDIPPGLDRRVKR